MFQAAFVRQTINPLLKTLNLEGIFRFFLGPLMQAPGADPQATFLDSAIFKRRDRHRLTLGLVWPAILTPCQSRIHAR
ncbi:hypothetical protein GCM10007418_19110 [Halopseudomonas salina]|uniref:Uncharacterized protein n=1 Tax=Halopseudomonas salina TaxID=1323744 RepID=A0ABQ1PNA1_9GAMM|nr:hypothetical protein GCM10007418_19110 [Halopseudomonas salina]